MIVQLILPLYQFRKREDTRIITWFQAFFIISISKKIFCFKNLLVCEEESCYQTFNSRDLVCRSVKLLSLEGCPELTAAGLELVVISWMEIQSLRVVSCNKIKDTEISPVLSYLFSTLKDLQWRPDTKSLLSANLVGSGMGKRGAKFFKKTCDWKALTGA